MLHSPKTIIIVILKGHKIVNLIMRRFVISVPEILVVKSRLPKYLYCTWWGSTYYQSSAVLSCQLITVLIWQRDLKMYSLNHEQCVN